MLRLLCAVLIVSGILAGGCASTEHRESSSMAAHGEVLPSWEATPTRDAIVDFVSRVTDRTSPDYVPPADRIAVFDNDGTLWCEQPLYTQFVFALDRVRSLSPQHPEWQTTEPFRSVLANDLKSVMAGGHKAIAEILAATHANMSTVEFERIVSEWIATAKHPRFDRLYTRCIYQPQCELLEYLRANGFRTFIVSGGGIEFMRPWTSEAYGIDPPQVVGSSIVTEFQMTNGEPVLIRQPKINFIDDKAGKPVGIARHIGQRPILAVGNSDGDRQMLEYTTIGNPHPSLGMLVLHTDAVREYAYGPADGLPDSKVGTFPQSLMNEADQRGWTIINMKEDWSVVFPE